MVNMLSGVDEGAIQSFVYLGDDWDPGQDRRPPSAGPSADLAIVGCMLPAPAIAAERLGGPQRLATVR